MIEVRAYYVTESWDEALAFAQEMARCENEQRYSGWAIVTPEDNLVLLMKHQQDGVNHRYLCLEEIGIWLQNLPREGSVDTEELKNARLLMMEHQFGHDLHDSDMKQIIEAMRQDLLVFE